MEQALSGVRILDLTRYIAGPYCTRILAGYGAEVIKVERPGAGDPARNMGPFLDDVPGTERSGLFIYLNGNKKGISLNLKSQAGLRIFNQLASESDVIVENFRPGVMKRLGLDYEVLAAKNPGLILTSISNFGQMGRYRDYKSSHLIAWGMSGGRYNDGEPGRKPVQGPGWITHYITGLFAVAGTSVALLDTMMTGTGQQVDVSMMESVIMVTTYPAMAFSFLGLTHTNISGPREIFPARDGYVGLHAWGLQQWKTMCVFLGVPEIADDPKYQPSALFRENRERVREVFAAKTRERGKMELFQSAAGWHIPVSFVATARDILASPQHQARNFFDNVDHPVIGKVTLPGAPFKMSETPWQYRYPAPLLGQHNEEIFCGHLGYTKQDMVRLREQAVI